MAGMIRAVYTMLQDLDALFADTQYYFCRLTLVHFIIAPCLKASLRSVMNVPSSHVAYINTWPHLRYTARVSRLMKTWIKV